MQTHHHRTITISAVAVVAALCMTVQATAQQTVHNNVVIVFDDSGSMDGSFSGGRSKMEAGKAALVTLLGTMNQDTHIGILLLNGDQNGRWFQELGPVDRTALTQNIGSDLRTNGGTPLYRSMKDGMDALLDYRGQHFYGNYRLVIVTDGEETENTDLLERYLPDMLTRGIQIDVIAVGMPSGHTLKTTADETSVVTYRSADDPESLTRAIQEVVSEIDATSDTADEDYALVAALPDGFAEKALQALVASGNGPIGTITVVQLDDEGNVEIDQSRQPVLEEPDEGGGFSMSKLLMVFVVLAVGAWIVFNRMKS